MKLKVRLNLEMKIGKHPFWTSPVGSQLEVIITTNSKVNKIKLEVHSFFPVTYQAIVYLPLENPKISFHNRSSIVKILEREWLSYQQIQINYNPSEDIILSKFLSEDERTSTNSEDDSPRSLFHSPRILRLSLKNSSSSTSQSSQPTSPNKSWENSPRSPTNSPRFWKNSPRFK
jgi:hypothetical protein